MTGQSDGLELPLSVSEKAMIKQLARLEAKMNKTASKMEASWKSSSGRYSRTVVAQNRKIEASLDRLAARGTAAGKALVAGLVGTSVTAGLFRLQSAVRGTIADLSDLGKVGDRVGINVEDLQAIQYGFRLTGVETEQLNGSLVRFGRRVGEALNGTGELMPALKRYGISVRDSNGEVKSQIELMREVAEVMRRLSSEQERLALADRVFGEGGRSMVNGLTRGKEGVDEMIRSAREGGLVIEESLIRKAEVLDDKFEELSSRMSVFGKRIAVGLAEGVGLLGEVRSEVDKILGDPRFAKALLGPEGAGQIEDPAVLTAHKRQIEDLMEEYDRLFDMIARLGEVEGVQVWNAPDADARRAFADLLKDVEDLGNRLADGQVDADGFRAELVDIADEADALREELQSVDDVKFGGVIADLGNLVSAIRTAITNAAELSRTLPGYVASGRGDGSAEFEQRRREGNSATPLAPQASPRPRPAPPMVHERVDPGRSGGGSGGGSDPEWAREVARIRERTEALEAEAEALIGLAGAGLEYSRAADVARVKAKLLQAAQRDGQSVTPELKRQIEELAMAYVRAGDAAGKAEERMRRIEDAAERGREAVADLMFEVVSGSGSARDALSSLVAEMAKVQFRKAILGLEKSGSGGGLFGWLGGLLTESFEGGGYTGSGSRSGGVDGRGGFPAILHPNETVIDHAKGGGPGMSGKSVVRVELGEGLVGHILSRAGQQTLQLVSVSSLEQQRAWGGQAETYQARGTTG